jgi:hypothetical protein
LGPRVIGARIRKAARNLDARPLRLPSRNAAVRLEIGQEHAGRPPEFHSRIPCLHSESNCGPGKCCNPRRRAQMSPCLLFGSFQDGEGAPLWRGTFSGADLTATWPSGEPKNMATKNASVPMESILSRWRPA